MTIQEAIQTLGTTQIFTVEFIKKDGTLRVMNARMGVKKGVKGVGMSYNPHERGMIVVYDMQKGAFRMVNVETIVKIRVKGNEILFEK